LERLEFKIKKNDLQAEVIQLQDKVENLQNEIRKLQKFTIQTPRKRNNSPDESHENSNF